jgi:hypothetical protein
MSYIIKYWTKDYEGEHEWYVPRSHDSEPLLFASMSDACQFLTDINFAHNDEVNEIVRITIEQVDK